MPSHSNGDENLHICKQKQIPKAHKLESSKICLLQMFKNKDGDTPK